jgi:hypothetical protein
MNKNLVAVAAIIVFLAFSIPLASSRPDGLERVVETFEVTKQASLWNGIMSDYTIAVLGDSYVSTLLAGVVGTFIVLIAGTLLGRALAPKKPKL